MSFSFQTVFPSHLIGLGMEPVRTRFQIVFLWQPSKAATCCTLMRRGRFSVFDVMMWSSWCRVQYSRAGALSSWTQTNLHLENQRAAYVPQSYFSDWLCSLGHQDVSVLVNMALSHKSANKRIILTIQV